jgi:hypothetical protein
VGNKEGVAIVIRNITCICNREGDTQWMKEHLKAAHGWSEKKIKRLLPHFPFTLEEVPTHAGGEDNHLDLIGSN